MRQDSAFRIAGLGEVLWDILPSGKALGGAPTNFAYHAARLGGNAHLMSRVGNDELGRATIAALREAGIDVSLVEVDASHATGTVDVTLDDSGSPTFVIHENVAWDTLRFTDQARDLAERMDAVAYGTLAQRSEASRTAVRAFLDATSPDCLRIFDVNLRQKFYDGETIRSSLERANVLKLSEPECPVVAEAIGIDAQDPREWTKRVLDACDLRMVALTRGDRGSLVRTKDAVADHPGIEVQVVDTVGAGDAFTAAMAMGLLQRRDLDQINLFANRVAAYVCTKRGAMPEVSRSIVDLFLEE